MQCCPSAQVAAAALAAAAENTDDTSRAPARVGLIGAGSRFCQKQLLPHLARLHKNSLKSQTTKPNIRIAAIWSVHEQSCNRCLTALKKLKIDHSSIQAHTGSLPPESMLAACDVVIVTTPPSALLTIVQHVHASAPTTHIISTHPACTNLETLQELICQISMHRSSSYTTLSPAASKPTFKSFAAQHAAYALCAVGPPTFKLQVRNAPTTITNSPWRQEAVYTERLGPARELLVHYMRLLRVLFGVCTRVTSLASCVRSPHDTLEKVAFQLETHFDLSCGMLDLCASGPETACMDSTLEITYPGTPTVTHTYDMSGADFLCSGAGSALTHCLKQVTQAGTPSKDSAEEAFRDCVVADAVITSATASTAVTPQALNYIQRTSTRLFSYTRTSAPIYTHIARCASTADVVAASQSATAMCIPTTPVGCNNSSAVCGFRSELMMMQVACMDRILAVTASTITVQPAATLRMLTTSLAALSKSLSSLPILLDQTVAGGCSTGTHGSSFHQGTLSDSILEITLVTRSGQILVLNDNDGELMQAARCGLGKLGTIACLTFSVSPLVKLSKREVAIDINSGICEQLVTLGDACEHIWVHWRLGATHALALCLERDEENGKQYDGRNWFPFSAELDNYMKGHAGGTAARAPML